MINQNLADWMEWKQKCAILKCASDVRYRTAGFLWATAQKFTASLNIRLRDLFAASSTPEDEAADSAANRLWTYFEHRATAGRHANGKHYKDWIFDHSTAFADDAHRLSAILKGVQLQMKMVMRDVLASEISLQLERRSKRVEALSYISGSDHDLWLEEVVAQADELLRGAGSARISAEELADYENIAADIAQPLWAQLSKCERVALWAKSHGLALDDDGVLKMAGTGKSQLYASRKQIEQLIDEKTRQMFPGEDEQGLQILRASILHNLLICTEEWKSSEFS